MRTKDSELVQRIKSYIEDQCEQMGRIPPIREIAEALGVWKEFCAEIHGVYDGTRNNCERRIWV